MSFNELLPYIENLDLPTAFLNRIEEIYGYYEQICPEEIKAIFVTNYVTQEGIIQYQNLWFFSDRFCMEAKQCFSNNDIFDIMYQKNVFQVQFQKAKYDFIEPATPDSRLEIEVRYLRTNVNCMFNASGKNCDNLKRIYLEYIKPYLYK